MRRKRILVLITVFVTIVVIVTLLFSSASQSFLFSEELTVDEITPDQEHAFIYYIKDDEVVVAHIFFRIDYATASSENPIVFSITPYNQTEIDSLTLSFSAGHHVISLYSEATTCPFKDTSFRYLNNEAVLKIPDADEWGSSTIHLDFVLGPCDAERLNLVAELSMHKMVPLQLTSQKAQVFIDADIPRV